MWIYEDTQEVARFVDSGEVCAGVKDLGLINEKVIVTTGGLY